MKFKFENLMIEQQDPRQVIDNPTATHFGIILTRQDGQLLTWAGAQFKNAKINLKPGFIAIQIVERNRAEREYHRAAQRATQMGFNGSLNILPECII